MVLNTVSHCAKLKNIKTEDYILGKYSPAKLTESYLEVVFHEKLPDEQELSDAHHGQLKCTALSFPFERSPALTVPIKSWKVLVHPNDSETSFKKVLEVSLDTSHHDLLPGDTIGIIPSNTEADVDLVLRSMNLQYKAEVHCSLQLRAGNLKKTAKVPQHVPNPSTPLEILRDCLALRSVPKKQFLSALAICCSDDLEKRFLSCLSSKEGASLYNDLILKQGLTLVDLLHLCPSCHPSLSLLTEQLPRLLPRPYSIAASPLTNNDVKIIFSILSERPGITTLMLENLCKKHDKGNACSSPIGMYFRQHNRFRYSHEDAENDNILIGVGTGVAPFLGFLEHKKLLRSKENLTHEVGNTWLFTGAKTHNTAFGRQRFEEYVTDGTLQRYFEAFSQIKECSMHYVQDLLQSNCMEFVEFLMKPKTSLYVCADGAQISKSIESCIKQCLIRELQFSDADAENQIKEFRNSGKYREDLWV